MFLYIKPLPVKVAITELIFLIKTTIERKRGEKTGRRVTYRFF